MSCTTFVDLIKADHANLKSLYSNYIRTDPRNHADREKLLHLIIREISMHSGKEETVIYPALRKYLGSDGNRVTDHHLNEHQTVKNLLYELDNMDPNDSACSGKLKTIMDHLFHHMEEEETTTMPRLLQLCGMEKACELGKEFNDAAALAPTRPHPSAPAEGLAGKAAAVFSKPIDSLRDAARFGTDEGSTRAPQPRS